MLQCSLNKDSASLKGNPLVVSYLQYGSSAVEGTLDHHCEGTAAHTRHTQQSEAVSKKNLPRRGSTTLFDLTINFRET
ncbi:hypothetical protein E2C01_069385 [Portunus trituberculatus]|uniref:Uncharacterized protein n=1 Tax=Portunus trituberculatus TaxID=210409 RepID=A0A5B7HUE0_PORTR|nr:hypothetical protein [Portunus trituberculatus]